MTRNPESGALCPFCSYEALVPAGAFLASSPYDRKRVEKSLLQLHRYCSGTNIRIDGIFTTPPAEQCYSLEARDLDSIGCLFTPLFADNLNDFFRARYLSLKQGGMLMILCPVKSRFKTPASFPGQKHVFGRRSLFYLLERHGFKLHWKDRFRRNPLCLVVKKM